MPTQNGQDARVIPYLSRRPSRRSLLKAAGAALAMSAMRPLFLLRAQETASAYFPRLKITDVESHEIMVPYRDFVSYELNHYYGPSRRFIYVVRTNSDLVGLTESKSPLSKETIESCLGQSPFNWVADETSLSLATAMYDLMGKAAGIPVHKLIGPKHRSWVPAAAWTVSTHPRRMARSVQKYAAMGYTWMKYHLSPFENVLDQMEAMQQVAPRGFRVHHDFTMGGTSDHTFELLEKISKFPIAGCFEDPLPEKDIQGYAELRAKCRLPILYHHSPIGAGHETQFRAADGYILGHSPIGDAIRHAGLFAQLDLPFSLQNTGGTITLALVTHMHAAFQTATLHSNSLAETFGDDVVKERLEPKNGWIRVPETPGLGVSLDMEALERLKSLRLPEQPKWIIRSRYSNGTMMYNLADTMNPIFMVRPDGSRQITLSYDAPITTEYWDPDGTPAFAAMLQRLEREGTVIESS